MLAFKNLFKAKKVVEHGRYGVELAPTGITVVHLDYSNAQRPILDWCELRDEGRQNWTASLVDIGKSHPYLREPCSIALHPDFYQFMLIDSPDVDDSEIQEAVKWRVADLVENDIDDVVVEVLRLPEDAYRGRLKMVYVAIVEKKIIRQIATMMEGVGLSIDSIGISELSLVEYMNWLEGYDDLDLALIQVGKEVSQICLMAQRQVYMARGIELSDDEFAEKANSDDEARRWEAEIDSVILDVQRSLDYYESQLGKPAIEMAFVFSAQQDCDVMLERMSEQLNIPLTEFPVEDIIEKNTLNENRASLSGREFLALGAALGGCYHRYHPTN